MGEYDNIQVVKIKGLAGHNYDIILKDKDDTKPEKRNGIITGKTYSNPLSLTTQFYFCPVPLRLDTYSGCSHSCLYCFANNSNQKYISNNNLLNHASNLEADFVRPTKIEIIKKYFDIAFNGAQNTFSHQEALAIECLKHRVPIHFGGMSDGLQPIEKKYRITYKTLKLLKDYNYPVIFSTKGRLLLEKEYFDLINDYENFALQISLIDDRQEIIDILEPRASTVEERFKMFEMYRKKWTACRIQPFIVGLSESRIIPMLDKLKEVGVNHIMVEGLKFFSGNKTANKVLGEAFKKITGETFDLFAYYKAIGAVTSGNDVELPSWRKYKYNKIFQEETKKRGMTFGCADNDLRFLGDSACCCGVEGLKGFENIIRHNTGTAIFNCLRKKKNKFDKSEIEKEWLPEGCFRQIISLIKLKKRKGANATHKDAYTMIDKMFNDAWEKGLKNSPCDVCSVKYLGSGRYRFLTEEELNKVLRDRGVQKRLF